MAGSPVIKRLIGAFALLAVSVAGWTAPVSELEAFLSRMEKADKELQSLSFQFTQTAVLTVTGQKETIRGTALFRKPSKFRVEHKSPRPQTVVSDGEPLRFYNPAQNQVVTDRWDNWTRSAGFPQGLMPFGTDTAGLREKYEMVLEKKVRAPGGEGAVLKLSPRRPGPWPYTFRLWVDGTTGIPFRTELDSESVKTVTEIAKTRVNPDLADDLFVFEAPEGAEVLGTLSSPMK